MFVMIYLILSIVIALAICNKINRNTIGTTRAYIQRFFMVWMFTVCGLGVIFGGILSLF